MPRCFSLADSAPLRLSPPLCTTLAVCSSHESLEEEVVSTIPTREFCGLTEPRHVCDAAGFFIKERCPFLFICLLSGFLLDFNYRRSSCPTARKVKRWVCVFRGCCKKHEEARGCIDLRDTRFHSSILGANVFQYQKRDGSLQCSQNHCFSNFFENNKQVPAKHESPGSYPEGSSSAGLRWSQEDAHTKYSKLSSRKLREAVSAPTTQTPGE